ncbi:MAG: hypothetical protein II968_05935 [Selenomonadaceae bacterium]|nr:hypothetical protein [Selenomonadaceae bacterium]MBR6712455.1 hypothetical protein [Selenomonadaceae bacterium]
MFQKIQKAFEKFVKEKGQGTVEYALILGFVAIIAVYMLSGSGLRKDVQVNVNNADAAATDINAQYTAAKAGKVNQ